MTSVLSVGDAACYKKMGVIVRIDAVGVDTAVVATPSEDTYELPLTQLQKLDLNSLELAVSFNLAMEGNKWGGWNEQHTMPVAGN